MARRKSDKENETGRDASPDAVGRNRRDERAALAIPASAIDGHAPAPEPLGSKEFERRLAVLNIELVKWQEWIHTRGLRLVVLFEGRDAAGKGGAIKRITEPLNPRFARVVALPGTHGARAEPVVLPAVRGAPARGG